MPSGDEAPQHDWSIPHVRNRSKSCTLANPPDLRNDHPRPDSSGFREARLAGQSVPLALYRELGPDQAEAKAPGDALRSVVIEGSAIEGRSPGRPDSFGPCPHGLRSEPPSAVRGHRFDTRTMRRG